MALQRRARAATEYAKNRGNWTHDGRRQPPGRRVATAKGADRQPSPSTRARTAVTAEFLLEISNLDSCTRFARRTPANGGLSFRSQLPTFAVIQQSRSPPLERRNAASQNSYAESQNWKAGTVLATSDSTPAPVANLQQQSAATKAQPGGCGCDYSRLARRKRRSMRPAPPLCKQGVSNRFGTRCVAALYQACCS